MLVYLLVFKSPLSVLSVIGDWGLKADLPFSAELFRRGLYEGCLRGPLPVTFVRNGVGWPGMDRRFGQVRTG